MPSVASRGFSVVIPVYNESAAIRGCLDSLVDATLPDAEIEILVADGMSDDGTRAIVGEYPSVRLIDNEEQTTPAGFNRGFELASNDIIVLMSGHARVSPDFFNHILELFETHAPDADVVGSRVKPVADGYVQTSIAGALTSRLGAGSERFRAYEGYVDTVSYGAYKREVIETVGRMNPELPRGQDYEYNKRVREHGFEIYQSAESTVRYEPRSTFYSLFKQKFGNGRGKASIRRNDGSRTECGVGLFATLLAVGLLTPILPGVLALLAVAYAVGVAATVNSVIEHQRRLSGRHAFGIVVALLAIHVGYATGYLVELLGR
ncbi:glycosyltransferase [Halosegnis longus]|uniref:glycosyltransferase n=1 Tax=Halosegnis longus TaxID=2216012 RepID=UPI00096A4700|nr:glycosyltransferase family 2 protein [Salella cibi]